MSGERFATYLKAQYAPTNIKKSAFENASSHGEVYDSEMTFLYGGEFGFLYKNANVGMRFGLEVIRPPTTKANAADAAGTALYALNSDVSVVIPKIGFEYKIKQWHESRLYVSANYGSANLGLTNAYTFTAAGTTATSKSDYTEEGRGSATTYDGALGFETLLVDNTTISFEVGYRSLNFSVINHSRDADTIAQNSVTKGTQMLNADGTARTLNFSGDFANIVLRFWVF
jgi:hypothetical protein